MPAKVTLFGMDCQPKADFGSAHRNAHQWSPSGQLISFAGFGNLQGEMDIWDPKKLKKVAVLKSRKLTPNYMEWSPSGEYLLTACLFPRLRVDNCFQIWTPDGNLIYEETVPELSKISWRPALPGVFPIRKLVASKVDSQITAATTTTTTTTTATTSQPAKYRHPNFSGRGTVLEREEDGPQKYTGPNSKREQQNYPPGYVPESKTQQKNKKKRQNKKSVTTEPQTSPNSEPNDTQDLSSPQEIEKKKKVLLKKIRQIEVLREQLSEGKTLDEAQMDKVAMEDSLREQLNSLEALSV